MWWEVHLISIGAKRNAEQTYGKKIWRKETTKGDLGLDGKLVLKCILKEEGDLCGSE
jgi:hypothetical protein